MSKSESGRSAKVRPSEMITVPVRPAVRIVKGALDPRDLDLLARWIELNKDVLTAYWDGTIEYGGRDRRNQTDWAGFAIGWSAAIRRGRGRRIAPQGVVQERYFRAPRRVLPVWSGCQGWQLEDWILAQRGDGGRSLRARNPCTRAYE